MYLYHIIKKKACNSTQHRDEANLMLRAELQIISYKNSIQIKNLIFKYNKQLEKNYKKRRLFSKI
jgi:hypothetical protein